MSAPYLHAKDFLHLKEGARKKEQKRRGGGKKKGREEKKDVRSHLPSIAFLRCVSGRHGEKGKDLRGKGEGRGGGGTRKYFFRLLMMQRGC